MTTMNKGRIANKAIIRISNYSYERVSHIIENFINAQTTSDLINAIKVTCRDERVMQDLYIASPNLSKKMITVDHNNNEKTIKSLSISILNYLKRAYIRPTPFGLFSSVSTINLSKETQNNKEIVLYQTPNIEVSPHILFEIYNYCVDNIEKADSFQLYINPNLIENKSFYTLNVVGENPNYNDSTLIYYHKNNIIDIIASLTKPRIRNVYIKLLEQESNTLTRDFIEEYYLEIKRLLKDRILYLSIYPKNNSIEELKRIASIIKLVNHNLYMELNLEHLIKKISSLKENFNFTKYQETYSFLKSNFKSDNCLIINSQAYFKREVNILKDSEINNLELLINSLSNLNEIPEWSNYQLENYKNRFIEKYGFNRPVNIYELFDDSIGLGSPFLIDNYSSTQILSVLSYTNALKTILQKKKMTQKTIQLDKNDFLLLNNHLTEQNDFNTGFDINLRATSSPNNPQTLLWFTSIPFSMNAGSYSGRFSFLNHKIKPKNNKISLSYWPNNNKLWNVISHNQDNINSNLLVTGIKDENNKVTLKDIFVQVNSQSNEFEIIDINNNHISIDSNSMANINLKNDKIKFLELLSSNSTNLSNFINSLQSINSFYMPRIMFKNIVLTPERWIVDYKHHFNDIEPTREKLKKVFFDLKIPEKCLLASGDKIIPLNLNQAFDIDYVLKCLISDKILYFIEIEFGNTFKKIVDRNNNALSTEIVFSFIEEEMLPVEKSKTPKHLNVINKYANYRLKYFDGNKGWFYIKLYTNPGLQDTVILRLFSKMYRSNLLWFFIRYEDPNNHIRVRVFIEENNKDFIFTLFKLVSNFMENSLVLDYSIETYDPEIERYYVNKNSYKENSLEKLFNMDSTLVCYFIYMKNQYDQKTFDIVLLKTLQILLENIITLNLESFSIYLVDKKDLKIKSYKTYFDSLKIKLKHIDIPDEISSYTDKIILATNTYIRENNIQDNQDIQSLINSFIHIFFNRLFGDITKEQEYKLHLYRLLKLK